jgi:HlyD family secretion protein
MKKLWIGLLVAALILVATIMIVRSGDTSRAPLYSFSTISRGSLANTVSATGTLEPVSTVEIGTQVSGMVERVLVDYNDRVTSGQLLAQLDTTLLAVQLRDARINADNAKARLEESEYTFKQARDLYDREMQSEKSYVQARVSYLTAQGDYRSAQNAITRSERNLNYAFIRSPITGTVIDRSIEEGQTVAASLQAPVLFTLAEDLTRMEIHAQVDESDIGLMEEDLPVTFTVQAYPDRSFEGLVRQVRLQPESISNVVNYTVVIDAKNPHSVLLPGMTAMIDFVIESRDDILMVPVSAVKVTPSEDMVKSVREKRKNRMQGGRRDSLRQAMAGRWMRNRDSRPANLTLLWIQSEEGSFDAIPVRTGISDGRMIEIQGRRVEEGMRIVEKVSNPISLENRPGFSPPRGPGRRPF